MQDDDKPVLVYTTYPNAEAAEKTGTSLVEAGFAACVNIIPGMTSIYRWEGSLQRDSEIVMVIKTCSSLADAVIETVKAQHPYTTPAALILPITGGSKDYINWLLRETATPKDGA